jgi:outer membrane protein
MTLEPAAIRRLSIGVALALSRPVAAAILSAPALVSVLVGAAGTPACAETISSALARAYAFSPDLNAQRAGLRATDENLPKAVAGYRPTLTAAGDLGYENLVASQLLVGQSGRGTASLSSVPRDTSLTATETLFNGFKTGNTVRQSESQIFQGRESLRLGEENILSAAATAYMNVLRDTAILDLNNANVAVLQQQLKQTQREFQVGELTKTDVAQAQSSLAQGQAGAFTAQSNLQADVANYRQLIGIQPTSLSPARPLDSLLPHTLDSAVTIAQTEHPAIQAALHNVDAAALAVKIAEAALYPNATAQGSVMKARDDQGIPGIGVFAGIVTGGVTVPLYDGGVTFASVRQAKEQFGQARLQADLQREQIRAQVVSTWGAFQNTKSLIEADQAAVRAAEIALFGTRQEARVGERTTLDVLNAQQVLLNARVQLVSAQHDQVVNSYSLLAAIGRLSSSTLGLQVVTYDPTIHFDQVKDKWFGLRTPDGR